MLKGYLPVLPADVYRVIPIRTVEELSETEEIWKQFEIKIGHTNILSSYDWLTTWWEVFGKKEGNQFGYRKELLILQLYKQEELIAIAPFVKVCRKSRLTRKKLYIEFLTQQWGATFLDIIGHKSAKNETDFIFDWLYRNEKFDILNLSYIPENTSCFNLKGVHCSLLSACPIIYPNRYEDFEEYKNAIYRTKLRGNLNRALHYMKKNSLDYSFSTENINVDNLETIISISKSKLIDGKHCIYLDKDKRDFVGKICAKIKSNVVFLQLNGKKVAYRIDFPYKNSKFGFDSSYDRNYRKCELGLLLAEHTIKESFRERLDCHYEGVGLDSYKLHFTKEIMKIFTYCKPGNTFLARLHFIKEMRNIKRIENRILANLRAIKS